MIVNAALRQNAGLDCCGDFETLIIYGRFRLNYTVAGKPAVNVDVG
jgi:hypothetical protein